jgi:predicted DNA-binding ribbon-helix-helix protein
MKTAVLRRSITLSGRKTSVSLENEFWVGLREIASLEKTSVPALLNQINDGRDNVNLSSAIRLFVYNHFRTRMKAQDTENRFGTSDCVAMDDN